MGTIVDVVISSKEFALSETFNAVPDVTFEPLRVTAHEPGRAMQFLWASSSDSERLDRALQEDNTTTVATRLSIDCKHTLYHINWSAKTQAAMNIFVESNGTLLDVQGTNNFWEFRILFPDQAAVSTAYNNWCDHNFDPSIRHIGRLSNTIRHNGMGLSECQYKVITEAFRMGYYDIPRGITLHDLATNFDVSHQALSERLRRGHHTLIETTLCQSPISIGYPP
ncbi:helix-turn-helix domain-containing protein [Halorubraceae archaeon YAN]|nr:helix-turn-helix domain-containing protein [Halorubraceae archaeon YAN]